MPQWYICLSTSLEDWNLFPIMQVLLGALTAFTFVMDLVGRFRAGSGGVGLKVTRAEKSMGIFYGAYASVSGLAVAISLAAEPAKEHRVFFSILDIALVAYIFLLNQWSRNKLIGVVSWLETLEKR